MSKSLLKIKKRRGPSTEPCGTPTRLPTLRNRRYKLANREMKIDWIINNPAAHWPTVLKCPDQIWCSSAFSPLRSTTSLGPQNSWSADFSISQTFGTYFDHVTTNTLQVFKVKGSKAKVTWLMPTSRRNICKIERNHRCRRIQRWLRKYWICRAVHVWASYDWRDAGSPSSCNALQFSVTFPSWVLSLSISTEMFYRFPQSLTETELLQDVSRYSNWPCLCVQMKWWHSSGPWCMSPTPCINKRLLLMLKLATVSYCKIP